MRRNQSDKTLVYKGKTELPGQKMVLEKGPESLQLQKTPQGNLTEESAKKERKKKF